MSVLSEFLKRNQISSAQPLPMVHTTESYFLKKIIASGRIEARPCNVFRGENLSYFFVGRAAYKRELNQEAEYWELPSCVVFEYDGSAKRIFPFDSGAFKGRRYPNFLNMMDLSDFDAGPEPSAPQKIMGTFFTSNKNYYRLNARSRESFEATFDVDVLDEEIKALHRLIQFKNDKFDDRRFAIELQFENDVVLSERKPLLVVMPETYLDNHKYVSALEATGAEIQTYPLYPLRKEYYYYSIYEKLDYFYGRSNRYAV